MQKLSTEWGYSAPAAADLREKVNFLAVIDSSGNIALAGDGELAVGSITEGANTGDSATVSTGYILKVPASAAIAKGAKVAAAAAGKCKTAASGNFILGVALNAPTAVDVMCEILVLHAGRAA